MQDDETLAFYATNAAAYAQATRGAPPPMLAAFLDASYKAGDGPGRDDLGRYYNYPDLHTLECDYAFAAKWQSVAITSRMGRGYDNAPTRWLWVTARR